MLDGATISAVVTRAEPKSGIGVPFAAVRLGPSNVAAKVAGRSGALGVVEIVRVDSSVTRNCRPCIR